MIKAKSKEKEKEKEKLTDVEIEDVPGIGPTKAQQLREHGICSVFDLATAQMDTLAVDINVSKETAITFINSALGLLRNADFVTKEWVSASHLEKEREKILKMTTGSKALDKVLGGGIETQAVTEFYGEFGSGKSQICHTACAIAQTPIEEGGLGGNAIFIDTEETFRPDRLRLIANSRGMDADEVLNKTAVTQVFNSGHLELIVKDLGKYIDQFKAKLVIIDSLTSQYRSDYIGRGTLADRQQRLGQVIKKLVRTAVMRNIAVIVTNQVMSAPDVMFGDPIKPVGGHILGHGSTYRLYLKKSGHNRIATMVDSPSHPYAAEKFTITEAGVVDITEEKKK